MNIAQMSAWRWAIVIISVAGFGGVAIVWRTLDEAGPGDLVMCSIPLLVGLISGVRGMDSQYRILLMWVAAALSGLTAVLTIFSGAGLILLTVMLGYLLAAWMLNDVSASTTDPD